MEMEVAKIGGRAHPTAESGKPTKWHITIDGRPVTIEIERYIASGVFSNVYKIKSIQGLEHDEALAKLGKDLVLKILNPPGEIGSFNSIPELKRDVIARMLKGQARLRDAGIGQAEFVAYEESGIIIQQYVPLQEQPDRFFVFPDLNEKGIDALQRDPNLTVAAAGAASKRGQRAAVARLYAKANKADLVLLDGHNANLYLEKIGQDWEAKIWDQDLVATVDEVRGYENVAITKQDDGIFKFLGYKKDAPVYSKVLASYDNTGAVGSATSRIDTANLTAADINQMMLVQKFWLTLPPHPVENWQFGYWKLIS